MSPLGPNAFTDNILYLELDGVPVGSIRSFQGGNPVGDVAVNPGAPGGMQKKHLVGLHYEPIVIRCDHSMADSFFDWIADALAGNPIRKNGAVIAAPLSSTTKSEYRLDFYNAILGEIDFPAVDASSKDPIEFNLTIVPEHTTLSRKGTKAATQQTGKVLRGGKGAASNFILAIDGVDCSGVSRIESVSVTQLVSASAPAGGEKFGVSIGDRQVSNLVVTLSELKADDFYKWFQSFVVNGNNAESQERKGALKLVTNVQTSSPTILFTLSFSHLGMIRMSPVTAGAMRVQAEMYCNEVAFDYPKASGTSTSSSTGQTQPVLQKPSTPTLAGLTANPLGALAAVSDGSQANEQQPRPLVPLRSLGTNNPALRFRR